MLNKILGFGKSDQTPAEDAEETCFGRLELPAGTRRSISEESEQQTADQNAPDTERRFTLPAIQLPAMRLELAHGGTQSRDYGGGVIAGAIVATIGLVLFLLLFV